MKAKQNVKDVHDELGSRSQCHFPSCPMQRESVLALLRLWSVGVRAGVNAIGQAELGHPEAHV